MFVQIHMLQSLPPGNLNRDDTGQPKKCIFGGVTRGRISSQSIKRAIRRSQPFRDAFGDSLAVRTQYLPALVAKELALLDPSIPAAELEGVKAGISAKFRKEDRAKKEEGDEGNTETKPPAGGSGPPPGGEADQTPQLVFFPPPFAGKIAQLILKLRSSNLPAYQRLVGIANKGKPSKDAAKAMDNAIDGMVGEAFRARESLSVDVGVFGRMTTSDLIVDVEASCQVAHAISTHEVLIESDYFTAMDDMRDQFAARQSGSKGAAFLGSGDTETFFSSAVYYKYLNLDLKALAANLHEKEETGVLAAEALLRAAALANPTGKQNAFAAHAAPELILVELSSSRQPISYANAFLQPIEGGIGRNLMAESVRSLQQYIASVAKAFAPADMERHLLAVGHAASVEAPGTTHRFGTLDELAAAVSKALTSKLGAGVSS